MNIDLAPKVVEGNQKVLLPINLDPHLNRMVQVTESTCRQRVKPWWDNENSFVMVSIKFNSTENRLRVDVDKPAPTRNRDGFSVISSEPVEHVFKVEINQYTGALVAFELHIVPWDSDWWKNVGDRALLEYEPESDNLSIKFVAEGVAQSFDGDAVVLSDDNLEIPDVIKDFGLCDLVWKNDDAMISLSRNEVGNLIGIDILGLEDIIHEFKE